MLDSKRKMIRFPPAVWASIERYRRAQPITPTATETVLALVRLGLQHMYVPPATVDRDEDDEA